MEGWTQGGNFLGESREYIQYFSSLILLNISSLLSLSMVQFPDPSKHILLSLSMALEPWHPLGPVARLGHSLGRVARMGHPLGPVACIGHKLREESTAHRSEDKWT